MVNIAEVIYNGIAFDPKNWRHPPVDDLSKIPESVERLLDAIDREKIDCTLVGGLALLNYVEGRNTQDVDLILSLDDAKRIAGLIVKESDAQFALAEFEGVRVDLLIPGFPIHRFVHKNHATPIRYGTRTLRTATVNGMILLKLFALPSLYRQFLMWKVAIYEADVLALMERHRPDMPAMLAMVKPFVNGWDFSELQKIVGEIEQKLRRGSSRFGSP